MAHEKADKGYIEARLARAEQILQGIGNDQCLLISQDSKEAGVVATLEENAIEENDGNLELWHHLIDEKAAPEFATFDLDACFTELIELFTFETRFYRTFVVYYYPLGYIVVPEERVEETRDEIQEEFTCASCSRKMENAGEFTVEGDGLCVECWEINEVAISRAKKYLEQLSGCYR
jgi:hypothetical protein